MASNLQSSTLKTYGIHQQLLMMLVPAIGATTSIQTPFIFFKIFTKELPKVLPLSHNVRPRHKMQLVRLQTAQDHKLAIIVPRSRIKI